MISLLYLNLLKGCNSQKCYFSKSLFMKGPIYNSTDDFILNTPNIDDDYYIGGIFHFLEQYKRLVVPIKYESDNIFLWHFGQLFGYYIF